MELRFNNSLINCRCPTQSLVSHGTYTNRTNVGQKQDMKIGD